MPQGARQAGIRAEQTSRLDEPVSALRFASGTRLDALHRLGVNTVRDLLENYPRRYLDLSQVSSIASAAIGESVTVVGTIGEINVKKPRPRMTIVEASILDGSGVMFATYFSQPWMARRMSVGDRVSIAGKVEFNYGFKRMNSPFLEVLQTASETAEQTGRIIPMHPLTSDISAAWMRRLISSALECSDSVLDPLPVCLRRKNALIDRCQALRDIHFPKDMDDQARARDRLVYEELLLLQLHLIGRRRQECSGLLPWVHVADGPKTAALRAALPFKLTQEQETAVSDILGDMSAPVIMNRMLLGDVGTGKTAVAAFGLAAAADSGTQAAMMAPTSVLANQYGTKLGPLLDRIGVNWALLTGATSQTRRDEIISGLAEGSITVLFGTHALLEEDVVFKDLSFVVIDEQHRFGVEQRSALRSKGAGCDLLVMTATPIPRTLALTLFGDLECTYLKTRPHKLAKTKTRIIKRSQIATAYDAIRDEVQAGRQAYIVCPLVGVKKPSAADSRGDGRDVLDDRDDADLAIDEALEDGRDVSDAKAAINEGRYLSQKIFLDMEVGVLTGQMSQLEKADVMDRFRNGDIKILVSTTVIEVGVDVPNATVMLVEDADRFGLSQLHQLRGRVGRGDHPGSFFLLSDSRSEEARKRLQAIEHIDDGFELAEYDLQLRHEGDILGSRQSGIPSLKLVNIIRDGKLILAAHDDAHDILHDDPELHEPSHRLLAHEMERMFANIETPGGGA